MSNISEDQLKEICGNVLTDSGYNSDQTHNDLPDQYNQETPVMLDSTTSTDNSSVKQSHHMDIHSENKTTDKLQESSLPKSVSKLEQELKPSAFEDTTTNTQKPVCSDSLVKTEDITSHTAKSSIKEDTSLCDIPPIAKVEVKAKIEEKGTRYPTGEKL